MTLASAVNGTVNLHIWREGDEYLRQKGSIFLTQWNNLVFAALPGPPLANTRYVDLSTSPLGFPDQTFDVAYSYHVFEHLTPSQGERCARQIFNVLKPGGIFRISVPDLEMACRDYLEILHTAVADPSRQNLIRYRWAVMAIFEQMVRDRSGGLMRERMNQGEYDSAQLRQLFGDMLQPRPVRSQSDQQPRSSRASAALRRIYRAGRSMFGRSPRVTHRLDPRITKEAVQWMYDRLSLRLLLEQVGFEDVRQMDHCSSRIPDWSRYDFDRSSKGDYPLDPSVYLEGRRPQALHRAG